ncbi:hypothetical protein ACSMX9_09620 [Streptomyces sp. LE64]|uniref:hypothetical protein n=1 Tax=Streptomyces sp. LE64 TaxID=3448653 RepID=UPI00404155D7
MPHPSLRPLPQHPWPAPGSVHGALLLRDRGQTEQPGASPSHGGEGDGSGDSGGRDRSGSDRDNPFAPPPAGAPDRPWRPRRSEGSGGSGQDGDEGGGGRGPWGGQWSDRQPGRTSGRFGDRPGQGSGPEGQPPNMRWDPSDPAQRRARFALLTGMWAFFFALFSWPYVALMLGALAVYWGVSAVRGGPRRERSGAEAGDGERAGAKGSRSAAEGGSSVAVRSMSTAAISGLVTGGLALAMVAATFTAQLVYRDYYVCVRDALTVPQQDSCEDLLPKELRPLLSTKD